MYWQNYALWKLGVYIIIIVHLAAYTVCIGISCCTDWPLLICNDHLRLLHAGSNWASVMGTEMSVYCQCQLMLKCFVLLLQYISSHWMPVTRRRSWTVSLSSRGKPSLKLLYSNRLSLLELLPTAQLLSRLVRMEELLQILLRGFILALIIQQ